MPPSEPKNDLASVVIAKPRRKLLVGIVSGVASLLFAFLTFINVTEARGTHVFRWTFITIALAAVSILSVRAYLASRKKNVVLKTTDGISSNKS